MKKYWIEYILGVLFFFSFLAFIFIYGYQFGYESCMKDAEIIHCID